MNGAAVRQKVVPPAPETSMQDQLAPLETALGHRFKDRSLLARALTHSSRANESGGQEADNEQMEFLGDAVLGFLTGRELFHRFPGLREGHLSRMRAGLVSAKHLIEVAERLRLGEYLRLGRGEEQSGGRKKAALLVDALEAIVAAVYLDGGVRAAQGFVLREIVRPELPGLVADPDAAVRMGDEKSALQEHLQATGAGRPAYHVVKEEGPDHRKLFTVELRFTGSGGKDVVHRATGSTKKQAEQRAAQAALASI